MFLLCVIDVSKVEYLIVIIILRFLSLGFGRSFLSYLFCFLGGENIFEVVGEFFEFFIICLEGFVVSYFFGLVTFFSIGFFRLFVWKVIENNF